MFGIGSDYCKRRRKKHTVEKSIAVSMKDFRKLLFAGAAGTITWTWSNGRSSSIGFVVNGPSEHPRVNLHYRWADREDLVFPVRLEATLTPFGGRRWWFVCPIIINDTACDQRVGILYLPPGEKYFGCRKCHNLTYRSCQMAHRTEGLFG
jgi:hypothetical protein